VNVGYVFLKSLLDPLVLVVLTLLIVTAFSSRRFKKTWISYLLIPCVILLYGASIPPVSKALCHYLEKDYITAAPAEKDRFDVVVVLGGGVTETGATGETLLSQASAARLLHAVQVFRESRAPHLLCAGKGIGRMSEAEVMAAAAERLGVPREKILVDPLSENTREHVVEMDRRFSDKNIRIGLVTSAYHMKRSEAEFRKYFANVTPFPSEYLYSHQPKGKLIFAFIPSSTALFKSAVALHEMAGILWYRLKPS
jgi:uncharacterized SAM-binding protein YcdF (DUF218 family)